MNATTKATCTASSVIMFTIDLAKDVFELAFADAAGRLVERKRLKRGSFAVCLDNHAPLRIMMEEACDSAHLRSRTHQSARNPRGLTLFHVNRNTAPRDTTPNLLTLQASIHASVSVPVMTKPITILARVAA